MKPDEIVDKIGAFTFCLKFCKPNCEIQQLEEVGMILTGVLEILTLAPNIGVVQSKHILLESSGY